MNEKEIDFLIVFAWFCTTHACVCVCVYDCAGCCGHQQSTYRWFFFHSLQQTPNTIAASLFLHFSINSCSAVFLICFFDYCYCCCCCYCFVAIALWLFVVNIHEKKRKCRLRTYNKNRYESALITSRMLCILFHV